MTDDPSARSTGSAGELLTLVRVAAGPAGVRRTWAELISSLHGGIALLDRDARVEQVSAGFLSTTGLDAASVVGRDVREVFPALGPLDPRPLLDRAARGELVGVGQQVRGADGVHRWVRVTAVACGGLESRVPGVVFVEDTSETSHAMTLRRQATIRLTDVEEQELERLRRQLHDGPIQMLVALSWRLSLLAAETNGLQDRISELTGELRQLLVEFAPERDRSAGSLLERWIAPFLEGAPIELRIDDHLAEPPNRALTQAAFIFLYELVRAMRDPPRERRQSLSIEHERGGYRLRLATTTSGADSVIRGRSAAQYHALLEYARSLGGTLETEMNDDAIRTFSVWLPATAETTFADSDTAASARPPERHPAEWIRAATTESPRELGELAWERIVRPAPEPIIELDTEARWLFANPAYVSLQGVSEGELVHGEPATSRFTPDELAEVSEPMARAMGGEHVVFEWSRHSGDGQLRHVRVIGTPRFRADGSVHSALTVLADHSDLFHLKHLQASALSDLRRSRSLARRQSFGRLRQPLAALRHLTGELRRLEDTIPDADPIVVIRVGIEGAIRDITRSVDLLAVPELGDGDLGRAIRTSLESLLGDVVVTWSSGSSGPLTPDAADVLFRISREAVVNGVIHGRASRIDMSLRDADGGVELRIDNDGVTIDPRDLVTSRDHIGVQLMTERARAQSGTCRIEPLATGGTRVTVWLPDERRPR